MLDWREELSGLIQQKGYTHGVELGVYRGKSYHRFLKHNKKLQLTGVDSWLVSPGYSHYKLLAYEMFSRAIRIRYFSRARLIKGDIEEVYTHFNDESMDFIHYDLFNMRTSTPQFHENALKLWLPKIKTGGMIFGRDFHQPDLAIALARIGLNSRTELQLGKPNKILTSITI